MQGLDAVQQAPAGSQVPGAHSLAAFCAAEAAIASPDSLTVWQLRRSPQCFLAGALGPQQYRESQRQQHPHQDASNPGGSRKDQLCKHKGPMITAGGCRGGMQLSTQAGARFGCLFGRCGRPQFVCSAAQQWHIGGRLQSAAQQTCRAPHGPCTQAQLQPCVGFTLQCISPAQCAQCCQANMQDGPWSMHTSTAAVLSGTCLAILLTCTVCTVLPSRHARRPMQRTHKHSCSPKWGSPCSSSHLPHRSWPMGMQEACSCMS